jgi:hypothetical protein
MRKCSRCGFILGVCFCGGAIVAGEVFDLGRPSAPACEVRLFGDFGPPAGCDDGTSPHNRTGWVTSVAAASSSTTLGVHSWIYESPIVAFTARDAEDAAESPGPGFEVTLRRDPPKSTNGGSSST